MQTYKLATVNRDAMTSSLLLLLLATRAAAAFTTLPSRAIPPPVAARPVFSIHRDVRPSPGRVTASPSILRLNKDEDNGGSDVTSQLYTPLDRPLLAIVDTVSLVIFAAIGKSSHAADGSIDPLAVLVTAFPFVAAWLATSPLTAVYSPDDRDNNMVASTAVKVGKGWVLAVPLGIALRGAIKGYMPPAPFIIVTLISTLVILAGVRILFSLMEDFFVEFV